MVFDRYAYVQANGINKNLFPGVAGRVERLPVIQFTLTSYDLDTVGSKRSELTMEAEPFGVLRSYKFKYLIPTDWVNEVGGTQILFQMHGTEDPCDGSRSPCFALEIRGDKLAVNSRIDLNPITTSCPPANILASWPMEKGRFIDFELQAKWALDSSGVMRVLNDGKMIYSGTGPNCYNDKIGPYPKIGIYHWEPFPSYITKQVLYTTDLVITTL